MPEPAVADHFSLIVFQEHHVGMVRRAALVLSQKWGFSQINAHYVGIVASELANNLLFHATKGGKLSIRRRLEGNRIGLQILCEDEGPGILDINQAMQGGYSGTGTLGYGLSTIKNLMDELAIESAPSGTRIVVTKWQ